MFRGAIVNAKLCATVVGESTDELRARRDAAEGADMVELRLDYAKDLDVAGVLADRRVPVVVTCRPKWEGGVFSGSEEERRLLLTQAFELGAEYVDVEWRANFKDLIEVEGGRRIVLSLHDFEGYPTDLDGQLRVMRSAGAEVTKVAVTTQCLTDLVRLREFGRRNADFGRQVVIGMGAAGVTSRILPDLFNSTWTYAGDGVAPGQLSLGEMCDEYRIRSLGKDSELFGVLGKPLRHSLSPTMHNAGFKAIQRDAVYLPFEAVDIEDFETFVNAFDVAGASVTAPYKTVALAKSTKADKLSRRVGAANTLMMKDGGWHAKNTDVPGFLAPLHGRMKLEGCRVTVLGAGGAARGVVTALADEGAKVTVCARVPERAVSVAELCGGAISEMPPVAGTWDLLVNTTPVGTYPNNNESPVNLNEIKGELVYDLVYNPLVTRLLADASAAGCLTIGGLAMLVSQAEHQFQWWTGQSAPADSFRRAAETRLDSMSQSKRLDEVETEKQ